jgi:hypothetical protein
VTSRESVLSNDRIAAGRAALEVPLRRFGGGTATLREHLADPLVVLVWSSW